MLREAYQALGYAAGLRLQMTEYDVTVELIEA